jgi:hypothetical protein
MVAKKPGRGEHEYKQVSVPNKLTDPVAHRPAGVLTRAEREPFYLAFGRRVRRNKREIFRISTMMGSVHVHMPHGKK